MIMQSQEQILTIDQIGVNKDENSRTHYSEIEELSASIERDGQLQAVHVTPILGDDGLPTANYKVVAGFRRMLAMRKLAKRIGRTSDYPVKAIVVSSDEITDLAWLNLIENLHRSDLTSYEEARAYALLGEQGMTAKAIATRYGASENSKGRSESNIANLMRAYRQLTSACLKAWSEQKLANDAAFKMSAMSSDDQDAFLPDAKGKSGRAFLEALEIFENPALADGAPAGEGDDDGEGNKAKGPGRAAQLKAMSWADEHDLTDVAQTLRWILGVNKRGAPSKAKFLQVAGLRFDPKAKPEAAESEEGAE